MYLLHSLSYNVLGFFHFMIVFCPFLLGWQNRLSSCCWKTALPIFKAKPFNLYVLYYYYFHYHKHYLSKVVHTTVFLGAGCWFSPLDGLHSNGYSSHVFCCLLATKTEIGGQKDAKANQFRYILYPNSEETEINEAKFLLTVVTINRYSHNI